jgi:hypothetical protein
LSNQTSQQDDSYPRQVSAKTPGAVVVVKVDYRVVSHVIGIVGVIFQMKPSGGARIVTVTGLLLSGSRKGVWWIP